MTPDEYRRVKRLIAEIARLPAAARLAPAHAPTRAATGSTCGG